jgi:iron-sulfur cluster repair protein YtfE (RIC family)
LQYKNWDEGRYVEFILGEFHAFKSTQMTSLSPLFQKVEEVEL